MRAPVHVAAPIVFSIGAHDAAYLIGPALLLLYYLIVWVSLGRALKRGAIATQYQPPQGLSPAAMRYIRTMGCDGRTLAATMAQLAARGCLAIEPQDGKYKLTRLGGDPQTLRPPLAAEELSLFGALFDDGPTVVIDPNRGGPVNRYLYHIYQELQKNTGALYFTRNAGYAALGAFASWLTAMGMALTAHGRHLEKVPLVFLTSWFFFVAFFLGLLVAMNLLPAWGRMMRGLGGDKEVLIGSAAVAAFAAGSLAVLWQLTANVSFAYALCLAALVGINVAALPALKRLTLRGRQAREQVEGFRLFLEKVEQDRMQRLAAADPQAAAASEFVPYAIALEVREAWGDHLAEACCATTIEQ